MCSMAAFAVLKHAWSIAACAATDVYVLQQPVLPLDVLSLGSGHICVSLLQYNSLYYPRKYLSWSSLGFTWTYLLNSMQPVLWQKMAYSSLWCAWTVCLQEQVLHRDVSVYESFCVHLRCLSSVDYIDPVLHLCMSVFQSFVLYLCWSVYKSFVLHQTCLPLRVHCMLYL